MLALTLCLGNMWKWVGCCASFLSQLVSEQVQKCMFCYCHVMFDQGEVPKIRISSVLSVIIMLVQSFAVGGLKIAEEDDIDYHSWWCSKPYSTLFMGMCSTTKRRILIEMLDFVLKSILMSSGTLWSIDYKKYIGIRWKACVPLLSLLQVFKNPLFCVCEKISVSKISTWKVLYNPSQIWKSMSDV